MFRIVDGREYFYQWDLDRQVIVDDPSITEVHFCNRTDECSLVVEVTDGVANVPNIILQSSFDIRIFGYDGKATLHDKVFKVKPRTRPSDYVYTETEVKNYEEYIAKVAELEGRVEALEGAEVEVDLTDYVKNTDYATASKAGVVKVNASQGIAIDTNGTIMVDRANTGEIAAKTSATKPITPYYLNYAAKVGVTTNTIELTEKEKAAANNWLGVTEAIGNITKLEKRSKNTLILDDMNEGSKDFTVRLDAGKGGNKNLVFYPYTEFDYSNGLGSASFPFGITFTENEDGSIYVSCWTPPEEYAADAGFSPCEITISKVAIPADEDYCVLDSNLYVNNGYLCFFVDYDMGFDGNIYPQVEAGSTPTEFNKPAERIDVSNKNVTIVNSTNYLPAIDYNTTKRGVTITMHKEDGSLKITGTSTAGNSFNTIVNRFILPAGTYTYNRYDSNGILEFKLSINGITQSDIFTLEQPAEVTMFIIIYANKTMDITLYPQINAGIDLLDYEVGKGETVKTNLQGEIDKVFTAEIDAPIITTLENATICAKYSRKLEAVIEELTTAIADSEAPEADLTGYATEDYVTNAISTAFAGIATAEGGSY
jgi:hypothetical protein